MPHQLLRETILFTFLENVYFKRRTARSLRPSSSKVGQDSAPYFFGTYGTAKIAPLRFDSPGELCRCATQLTGLDQNPLRGS
eukprot:scaffold10_cov257-Pinguiococcus_pyrenoidosus.AAC.27